MSLNELDTAAFFFVNRTLNIPALDPVMVFITNWNVPLMIGVYLFIFHKERLPSLIPFVLAVSAFMIGDWTGNILKHAIQRTRPCNLLEGVNLLVQCRNSFAMPSNHAVNCFAAVAPFYVFSQKSPFRHVLLAIAALVALSRPYVGVHYPGDVLAGAIYGLFVGGTLSLCVVSILRRTNKAR